MKFQLLRAIVLLGVARVEGFGLNTGPRSTDELLFFARRGAAVTTNLLSWASRRSEATILRYRNSPHDTSVDYYNILGVPRTANDAEIKRAYRNLAKRFHPDANPDMDTTSIFQQLNRAYEVLKDKELRNQFDIFGSEGLGTSACSDKAATSRNVKRPTTVNRGRNPFYDWPHEPQPPPPRRPAYEQSPFDAQSNPNARRRQAGSHSGPRAQRPDSRFTGDSPFGSAWDPWKSPFADLYNSRMESEGYQPQQQDIYGDSRFVDNDVGFGAQHIHMGTVGGPSRRSMADHMDFTSTRPTTGGSSTRRRWVGGDLSIEMEIDLQTALEGGEEKIRIKHLDSCTTCTGNGIQPGVEVKTCEHCRGTGAVLPKSAPSGFSPTENYSKQEICRHCRGTGQIVPENCMTCHGKGVKEASKDITVLIPRGVGEGAKLRLKGEGDAGPMGGPAGDLFIFLTIRKGNTEHIRMP